MLVRTLDQRATPGNALDIGCGAGTYSLYMAGGGYTVTAIDFMPHVKQGSKRGFQKLWFDPSYFEDVE